MLWLVVAASVIAMVLCAALMRAAGRASRAEELMRDLAAGRPFPGGGDDDA